MGETIYRKVKGIEDIRKINRTIREQVKGFKTKPKLTQLHKRSMYMVTLTQTPSWKTAFAGRIRRMRTAAKEEFSKTAKRINRRCEELGLKPDYDEVFGRGRKA